MAAAKTLGIKVVGLQVCEHLPKIASIADKIAVLRSVNAVGFPNAGDHNGGLSWKCGNRRGLAGTPKFPTYGSVVAKFAPTPQDLPPFVLMGDLDRMAPGMRENFLGPAYNPLLIHLGANQSGFTIDRTLMFPELTRLEVEQSEFQKRVQLQQALEKQLRHLESNNAVLEALDRFQQKAFSILQSPKLREAVDLSKESDQTKERYGLNIKGPYVSGPNTQGGNGPARMLAARRLIEAGVPFVHLDFGYWDWHPHDGLLENARALLHAFDAAFSALITDLDERGLLDTTLVVALGEMGRTPRLKVAQLNSVVVIGLMLKSSSWPAEVVKAVLLLALLMQKPPLSRRNPTKSLASEKPFITSWVLTPIRKSTRSIIVLCGSSPKRPRLSGRCWHRAAQWLSDRDETATVF